MNQRELQAVQFMKKALAQARKAADYGEIPVGALVVDDQGAILGRGYNKVEMNHTQAAHAELLALSSAGKRRGDWRLEGCTLYVTLEPCSMCMALIMLSRLERVVYAASSPQFGYHLDNALCLNLYKRKIEIIQGVCRDESAALLQSFFKKRRRGSEEKEFDIERGEP